MDDWLPLHLMCASRAPPEVVSALLEAFPDRAQEKDKNHSRLPLHFACWE